MTNHTPSQDAIRVFIQRCKKRAMCGGLGFLALLFGCADGPVANRQSPASNAPPSATPTATVAPDHLLGVPADFKPDYKFLRAEDSSIRDRNSLDPIKRKTISVTLPDGLDRQAVELNLRHAAKDLYDKEKPDALIVYGYRKGETGASPYSVGMLTYAPYGDWGRAGEKPSLDKYETVLEVKESYLNPAPGEDAASSGAGGLEKKALAGDYQSQRNLAYYLITGEEGVKADPVMACAWRIVILKSGHSQADASDTSNKQFDCDQKLNPAQLRQAESQAAALMKRSKK